MTVSPPAGAGCVVDANVVIAVWSTQDRHHAAARELLSVLADQELWMHPVTAAEVLVGPARRDQASEAMQSLVRLGVRVQAMLPDEAVSVATTRAQSGLRLPDACVLHLASTLGASLATFDARLGAAAVARGIAVVG